MFFLMNIEELMKEFPNLKIPPFIKDAVKYLKQGIETVGIFRVPGSEEVVRNLKISISRGEQYNLSSYPVHDVAGLLKRYFIEMPEPLLTFELSQQLLDLMNKVPEKDARIAKIKEIISKLSPERMALLRYLTIFLVKVAAASEKNKMNSKNLGIVFGPSLLQIKEVNLVAVLEISQTTAELVAFFIDHCPSIFKDTK